MLDRFLLLSLQIFVTPHNSAYFDPSRAIETLLVNVDRYLRGEKLLNEVDLVAASAITKPQENIASDNFQ